MAEVGLADLITAINQAMLDAQTAVTVRLWTNTGIISDRRMFCDSPAKTKRTIWRRSLGSGDA